MKAAIYARVSTAEQTVENQRLELSRYCEARGWTATEYLDEGVSGAKESRPALDRLLTEARRRRFDTLVVWKLDRLGRNLRHLILLLDELSALGVAFVRLNEGIDTTTPAGRLQMHLLGAVAEYERGVIAERVKLGMARAKAQGKPVGRPRRAVTEADLAGCCSSAGAAGGADAGCVEVVRGEMAVVHKVGRNGRCKRAEFLGDSDLPMRRNDVHNHRLLGQRYPWERLRMPPADSIGECTSLLERWVVLDGEENRNGWLRGEDHRTEFPSEQGHRLLGVRLHGLLERSPLLRVGLTVRGLGHILRGHVLHDRPLLVGHLERFETHLNVTTHDLGLLLGRQVVELEDPGLPLALCGQLPITQWTVRLLDLCPGFRDVPDEDSRHHDSQQ